MTEFRTVANTGEIKPNAITAVDLDGGEVAIVGVDGAYLAFSANCRCISAFSGHRDEEGVDGHFHVGNTGYLPDGKLAGKTVECPMHQTVYDIQTGAPLSGPGESPISTYEVRVDGNNVSVATQSDSHRHFWHDEGEKDRPEIER